MPSPRSVLYLNQLLTTARWYQRALVEDRLLGLKERLCADENW